MIDGYKGPATVMVRINETNVRVLVNERTGSAGKYFSRPVATSSTIISKESARILRFSDCGPRNQDPMTANCWCEVRVAMSGGDGNVSDEASDGV